MDKKALIEAINRKAADTGGQLPPDEVERVIDALFGTVEVSGVIAESLKRGETVAVLGFGDFHLEGGRPMLRPGQALHEYINGTSG
ncbi:MULTISPECIES: HU family DNA-binding protein [unclassified Streptomyces]|uniref:HU family DNA-binding protein n=1 Tax=unclassified Streptomyces TaxID=2593676 RepID=UPI003701C12A